MHKKHMLDGSSGVRSCPLRKHISRKLISNLLILCDSLRRYDGWRLIHSGELEVQIKLCKYFIRGNETGAVSER